MKLPILLLAIALSSKTANCGGDDNPGKIVEAKYKADGSLLLSIEGPFVQHFVGGGLSRAQFTIKRKANTWWSRLWGASDDPHDSESTFEDCANQLLLIYRSGQESKIGYMFTIPPKLADGSYKIESCFMADGVPYLSVSN